MVTVQSFFTVAEDRKIATHARARADVDMRVRTLSSGAAPLVDEMYTKRSAFGRWIVRKLASLSSLGAFIL